jgi:hypothetical protein
MVLPVIVSLSSVVAIFGGKNPLKELPESCILYFFNTGCYDWLMSMLNQSA